MESRASSRRMINHQYNDNLLNNFSLESDRKMSIDFIVTILDIVKETIDEV